MLRAEADRDYAADNLHRLEPLLTQQFVTVDQVEQARTLRETRTRAVQQATARVAVSEAHALCTVRRGRRAE
jgi:multidrug efflux system membrane fusion protein